VIEGLRALRPELWVAQAAAVLGAPEAIAGGDPRLRCLAARLAAGELVDQRLLDRLESPVDGQRAQTEALGDYEMRRDSQLRYAYRSLPLRCRLATKQEDLADAYDDEHLVVCVGCGVARPAEKVS
jgi:hypothetical protein